MQLGYRHDVIAQTVDRTDDLQCTTKDDGTFRIVVPEANYHFLAAFPDRVAAAIQDQECIAGRPLKLEEIRLSRGGALTTPGAAG